MNVWDFINHPLYQDTLNWDGEGVPPGWKVDARGLVPPRGAKLHMVKMACEQKARAEKAERLRVEGEENARAEKAALRAAILDAVSRRKAKAGTWP
jgi:hypothetical protein